MNKGLHGFGRRGQIQVPERVRPNDAGVLVHGGAEVLFLVGQNAQIQRIEPGYPGQRLLIMNSEDSSNSFADNGGSNVPGSMAIQGGSTTVLAGSQIEFVAGLNGVWRLVGYQSQQNVMQIVEVLDSVAPAVITALIPMDDTIPQIAEGTQVMSLVVTPKGTNPKYMIECEALASSSGSGAFVTLALFRDAITDAIAASVGVLGTVNQISPFRVSKMLALAGSTPFTISARMGAEAASNVTFNGQAGARLFGTLDKSFIRVTEYITQF